MNYSRRQLEAFGEPLGESVTRKEGGRIVYGGGGGGSPPATQTSVSDLPEWARPTAQRTIGKAEAITDVSQNPYQSYDKSRVAGFKPLQEQAFTGAEQLGPSALGAQAGQFAGAATLGALGTGYDPYQMGQFTGQAVGQYMNPYLEQAMAPQLREAQRASEIQRNADQARAVGAGAFGGSRQAIVEAERQRNLGQQLGDIRARGYMTAFDQAQQQFGREQQLREQSRQYGAGLGMQGLQTALQGAGMMGQLGGQQFGQQKDIIGLQSTLGAQQQALEQQKLTTDYQDFLNQQRYPYQQLEFMSNILRGTPMGTVNTLYGAAPTTGQQVGALGMGAYGLSQLFGKADGGMVSSYADGGSVTDEQNVEDIISKLSDAQLRQARQIALNQRDMKRVELIDSELAERASMTQGLGGAFNMLPQDQQDNVLQAANGGIIAFADGGYNPPSPDPLYAEASRLSSELPGTMYTAPTQEETAAGIRAQRGLVQEMMGADKLTPFMEELAAQRKQLKDGSSRDRGFAALAAIAPMLEGRGIASIGRGVSKFGAELGRLEKENRDADRLLLSAQTQLASAQQARADGQFDKASQLFRSGEDLRVKALDAKRDVLGRQANLQATMAGQALSAQGQKYGVDTQAATSREVANINARTQRETANRPGETERIMARIDSILSGKESFAGKTGEEGVKLFKQSLGEVGAARYGVTPGGERPATAPNAAAIENAISQAVRADPRSKPVADALAMAQLRVDSYTRKGQEVPPEVQQRLDAAQAAATALRQEHAARIRGAGPAGGAAATPGALPMPSSQAELVDGKVYQTARGAAKWDASRNQFIPVQ
jgi:hypothetical protein